MAKALQRPPREGVTPLVLEKVVWAGANLGSYQQAVDAIAMLAEITLAPKQAQRMTNQVGSDRVEHRRQQVAEHAARPLMERTSAKPGAEAKDLAVVMMDGGRFQRRDHFRDRKQTSPPPSEPLALETSSTSSTSSKESKESKESKTTHWREDKVGLVLSMQSEVHASDPAPEFPEWLVGAQVVSDIAKLAAREEDETAEAADDSLFCHAEADVPADWQDLAPQLVSREVVASSESSDTFGSHLESQAWESGIHAAKRQAFVADGLAVNWAIHKRHFSQMTGILDLMHALSYAWRAAAVLADPTAYRRFAAWIWQGQVQQVIDELQDHQHQRGLPEPDAPPSDPLERIQRAITYYTNHSHLMNYPEYRQAGLPLTSSLMESTIKQMNARVKGSEKFWNKNSGEAVLQLRADSLSDSQPLQEFWNDWRTQQTGTNTYRKLNA